VAFQKAKGAIDGATVDAGVQFLCLAEDLAGIEMLAGRFHHAEDSAALLGHPDSAFGKLSLQAARHFGLRQWHKQEFQVASSRNQCATISSSAAGQESNPSGTIRESHPVATELQLKNCTKLSGVFPLLWKSVLHE